MCINIVKNVEKLFFFGILLENTINMTFYLYRVFGNIVAQDESYNFASDCNHETPTAYDL